MKRFADLTEQEVLALSISNEDEDSRIYRGFAEGLRKQYPASAKVFDEMADEEARHRTMLFELYRSKFGEYLPLIRRQDVKGFITKHPLWLMPQLNRSGVPGGRPLNRSDARCASGPYGSRGPRRGRRAHRRRRCPAACRVRGLRRHKYACS